MRAKNFYQEVIKEIKDRIEKGFVLIFSWDDEDIVYGLRVYPINQAFDLEDVATVKDFGYGWETFDKKINLTKEEVIKEIEKKLSIYEDIPDYYEFIY